MYHTFILMCVQACGRTCIHVCVCVCVCVCVHEVDISSFFGPIVNCQVNVLVFTGMTPGCLEKLSHVMCHSITIYSFR